MSFIAAGEILGTSARVRTPTIAHHPVLPDGTYAMVETYCTVRGCDCRKTMILVHLNQRYVSTINFGWESPEFYARWFGGAIDDRALAEMKRPSIDQSSPDLVSLEACWPSSSRCWTRSTSNTCACSTPVFVRPLPCRPQRSVRRGSIREAAAIAAPSSR